MLNDIYILIYQDTNFKICLGLFGWKENILPKMHIVQCETSGPPRPQPECFCDNRKQRNDIFVRLLLRQGAVVDGFNK